MTLEVPADATWEADLLPVSIHLANDPASRPAVAFITTEPEAGGLVLAHDVLSRPSAEPDAMAEVLERTIRQAIDEVGLVPPRVMVADTTIAEALQQRLEDLTIHCAAGPTPAVDAAWNDFHQKSGHQSPIPFAQPETWAAWDQPTTWIASMFDAAARWIAAEPWWQDHPSLRLVTTAPSGRSWRLTMQDDDSGLAILFAVDVEPWSGAARDQTVQRPIERLVLLHFDAASALPRALQREVLGHGWKVAAATAYPTLLTVGTPAGGLRHPDAEDVLALLEAFARLAEANPTPQQLAAGGWTDPGTGMHLTQDLHHVPLVGGAAPERLQPGLVQGLGADPQQVLELLAADSDPPRRRLFEDSVYAALDQSLEIFEIYLAKRGRAASTIAKHLRNVTVFLKFLWQDRRITPRSLHELDLRVFLYHALPLDPTVSKTQAKAMTSSLLQFLECLGRFEDLHFPWADAILRDKATFLERLDSAPHPDHADAALAWLAPLIEALDDRVLLPNRDLGVDESWSPNPGPIEAKLHTELDRRWLIWRDNLIESEVTEPQALFDALCDAQLDWELTPHADLEQGTGRRRSRQSPFDAVLSERASRDDR